MYNIFSSIGNQGSFEGFEEKTLRRMVDTGAGREFLDAGKVAPVNRLNRSMSSGENIWQPRCQASLTRALT